MRSYDGSQDVVVALKLEGSIESVIGPFRNQRMAERWIGKVADRKGYTDYEFEVSFLIDPENVLGDSDEDSDD